MRKTINLLPFCGNAQIRCFSSAQVVSSIHQKISGRSRFYNLVKVEEVQTRDNKKAFKITLDGRNLRTPARNELFLPNETLASLIAAEWDSQTNAATGIQPSTMPLMTLASTAVDQLLADQSSARSTCLSYLPTDTALFWTTADDRLLLRKQRQHFEPILRWLKKDFGVVLKPSQGMASKIRHSDESLQKMTNFVHNLDHFSLACLQWATMECKSLVLAIAFLGGHLSVDQVKAASRLEEEFQLEIWGLVEGGHDMDRLNNSVSLGATGLFFGLLHDEASRATVMNALRS